MVKRNHTEQEYRCDGCGYSFPNSELVKARIATGSYRRRKTYNDSWLCRPCKSKYLIKSLVSVVATIICVVIAFPVSLAFLVGSNNKVNNGGNQQPNNSSQQK
jgi:rubredoxin